MLLLRLTTIDELEKLAQQFHKKIAELEESKYDLEYAVRQKDFEVSESLEANKIYLRFLLGLLLAFLCFLSLRIMSCAETA